MLHIDLGVGRKFGLGVKLFSCQCVVCLAYQEIHKMILYFYHFSFLKYISAVTLLSISFSIASPGEQQSYSFYNNAGNNHISRAAPFKELQQKQLDFSGKVKGILLEFGLKTCKLPEATKHQNFCKVAQNFWPGGPLKSSEQASNAVGCDVEPYQPERSNLTFLPAVKFHEH